MCPALAARHREPQDAVHGAYNSKDPRTGRHRARGS